MRRSARPFPLVRARRNPRTGSGRSSCSSVAERSAASKARQPVRIAVTASSAVVKIGCEAMYGDVHPLAALWAPPNTSSSAARPGWDPTCQNSHAIEVSGSTALPSPAAMARSASKSAAKEPVMNGVAVRFSVAGRTVHESSVGSHINSSSVRPFHARPSVYISMKSIISRSVSARFPATSGQ